jgi:hypothetical protein
VTPGCSCERVGSRPSVSARRGRTGSPSRWRVGRAVGHWRVIVSAAARPRRRPATAR